MGHHTLSTTLCHLATRAIFFLCIHRGASLSPGHTGDISLYTPWCIHHTLSPGHRPDITVMVDRTLKINYLSIYLSIYYLATIAIFLCMHRAVSTTLSPRHTREPAWPGGKAPGKRKDAGSTPRFGSSFSSKNMIYGHWLVTLPCTINETLKWLTSLAHLNADIILVVTV